MKAEKYVLNTNVPSEAYEALKRAVAKDGFKPMTDEEATDYVAKQFGFQHGLIKIDRQARLWLCDERGGAKATKLVIDREPLYAASDMNYVRFAVCGITYEVSDGHLEFVNE